MWVRIKKFTVDDLEDKLAYYNDPDAFRAKPFNSDSRKELCDRLESGDATPEMMKYAAELLRDPETHPKMADPNSVYLSWSKWWRDIEDIENLLSEGRYKDGFEKIAKHLTDGENDFVFQKFAGKILEEISTYSNLPKNGRSQNAALSLKVGDAFRLAKEKGIKGEVKKDLMYEKFNIPYKTLEKIWQDYKIAAEEYETFQRKVIDDEMRDLK